MTVEATGYGMGKKDFAVANGVRVLLGTRMDAVTEKKDTDQIAELDCNVDDMTGEDMGYCLECLMKEGARDAFVTPVTMKKNRPGMLLTVLCDPADADRMARQIFLYTTTIGIRKTLKERYVLSRENWIQNTEYGPIRYKRVSGYGVRRDKPEFEDVKEAAEKSHKSMGQIREELSKM